MNWHAIAIGINIAIGYWALRRLWKYQHRLGVGGRLIQAGGILLAGF